MNNSYQWIWASPVYLVLALVAALCLKFIRDVMTSCDDDLEIRENNLAMAMRRGGDYLALAIGLAGALTGPDNGFVSDVQTFMLDAAALVVLLVIAGFIADKLILPSLNNTAAIEDRKTAVGLVEFGVSVSTGILAFASFAGEGGGLLAAAVFFALGMTVLIANSWCYIIAAHRRGVALQQELSENNLAAGLYLSAKLVAMSLILATSIYGPFTGWARDLKSLALYAVLGTILLALVGWVVDLLFLPKTTIREEIGTNRNVAAIAVASSFQLMAAVLIAAAL